MFRVVVAVSCIALSFLATGCQRKKLSLNEELRLPADQISAYKAKAEQGDAGAAKKLWHHYTFVAGDLSEGKKWKETYDVLIKSEGAKGNQ